MVETIEPLLLWLENTALSKSIRQSLWLYPVVQIVHIAGIVILVGPAMIFDLRLLGFGRRLAVRDLANITIPWAKAGFVIVLVSGLLLFIAHATDWAFNPVFWVKMLLIIIALSNAIFFTKFILYRINGFESNESLPVSASVSAILSLIVWFSVIAAGRFLAYY